MLYNIINATSANDLYIENWLRWQILSLYIFYQNLNKTNSTVYPKLLNSTLSIDELYDM